MDESTVNILCPKNSSEFNNKTKLKNIDREFVNTRRHYFVKPMDEAGLKENLSKSENEFSKLKIEDYDDLNIDLEEVKGNLYIKLHKNILGQQANCIVTIGNLIKKHEINIYKILLQNDRDIDGII